MYVCMYVCMCIRQEVTGGRAQCWIKAKAFHFNLYTGLLPIYTAMDQSVHWKITNGRSLSLGGEGWVFKGDNLSFLQTSRAKVLLRL